MSKSPNHCEYYPGPISLIFGPESPIHPKDVSHYFPSRKRSLSCTAIPRQFIHHVSLLGCHFVDMKDVFRLLGKKLKRENHLKELAICRTTPKLSNDEMMIVARGLGNNMKLVQLDLTGGGFDAKGLAELKPFFDKNRFLEVLSLGENENIGDEGVQVILTLLRTKMRHLRVLSLERCGITNLSTAAPTLMQSVGSSLHILDLSSNNIGDDGVEKLAECMTIYSCQLKHLSLKNVSMGDRGLQQIADMLTTNRTIHTLDLQNNTNITDIGASHLLLSIYDSYSITSVVEGNHILKNIDLRGCVYISKEMLRNVCAMSKQPVRFKISKYFESFGCVSALGSIDSLLLPNILSFVGRENGLDTLFRTIKSVPHLYNNTTNFTKPHQTSTSFTMNESKSISKKLKKYHILVNVFPKLCLAGRSTENRSNWCKHELTLKRNSNNYLDKVLSNKPRHNQSIYLIVIKRMRR